MSIRGARLKDPDAVLDYVFDFKQRTNRSKGTDWLGSSETITSSTVTVVEGDVTVDSSGETDSDTSVTAWVSGGTAGTTAKLRCRVTTSDARTDDRTMIIRVRER